MVFAAANCLKLNATLKPIWQGDEDGYDDEDGYEDCKGDVLGDCFYAQLRDIGEEDFASELHTHMKGKLGMKDVIWCTGDRRAWSQDHAIATYGNEPATQIVYSAAAITIEVPPWSKCAVSQQA